MFNWLKSTLAENSNADEDDVFKAKETYDNTCSED